MKDASGSLKWQKAKQWLPLQLHFMHLQDLPSEITCLSSLSTPPTLALQLSIVQWPSLQGLTRRRTFWHVGSLCRWAGWEFGNLDTHGSTFSALFRYTGADETKWSVNSPAAYVGVSSMKLCRTFLQVYIHMIRLHREEQCILASFFPCISLTHSSFPILFSPFLLPVKKKRLQV